MTLRALTIRQPYAGLIAAGIKPVENRGVNVTLRGEVAIHAGKTPDLDELVRQQAAGHEAPFTVLGAVVAVADLIACHPAAGCCKPWGFDRHGDRPAHHLVLTDVRRLSRPVECRGQLGFWLVPADVEQAIRTQLSSEEA